MNEYDASEPRRRFVKKTIIGTIALSQPLLFTGLIRAQGGGSGSTTKPDTTFNETTDATTVLPAPEELGATTEPDGNGFVYE